MAKEPTDAEFVVVAEAGDPRVDVGIVAFAVAGLVAAVWFGAASLERGGSDAFYMGMAGGCGAALVSSGRSLLAHLRHRRRQVSPDRSGRTTQLQERVLDEL